MSPALELRDIHLPPEPSWWPPAPGWWLLALLLLALLWWSARLLLRAWRRRQYRSTMTRLFAQAAALPDPAARLAAVSQLLRRAARVRDPQAASLAGTAWLEFLDQTAPAPPGQPFSGALGALLVDGAWRREPDRAAIDALIIPARERFLSLLDPPPQRPSR